jgi:2-C-methyl-D-erythritol 2,4-cyclodiphosphate synthase
MIFRVGLGFDAHRLVEGRELWLGGVRIEHEKGALGHSDADVLLHAICDALLGAVGLGDIGQHFPDTDMRWKGADSKVLLAHVVGLLKDVGWQVGNVDATLVLERPRIKPHIEAMRAVIAPILAVAPDAVSIKATTNERMGHIGREEGLAAHAVALVTKG